MLSNTLQALVFPPGYLRGDVFLINSFLNCCQDLHKIDRWICVDDNSSTEDREEMKKLYPFFEFYFKNLDCKGHPQSMNLIRDLTKDLDSFWIN